MRPLDVDSVLIMSEIIDKSNLILDIQAILKNVKVDKLENLKDAQEIGKEVGISIMVQLAGAFLKSMHKSGKEIKKLIAYLTEKPESEVGKMSIKEMKEFFLELVNAEGFSDFFKQAVESTE